jgi:hypothetical protein
VNFMGCVSVWANCCCLAFAIQGELNSEAIVVPRQPFATT